jgi:hypothetical protein
VSQKAWSLLKTLKPWSTYGGNVMFAKNAMSALARRNRIAIKKTRALSLKVEWWTWDVEFKYSPGDANGPPSSPATRRR